MDIVDRTLFLLDLLEAKGWCQRSERLLLRSNKDPTRMQVAFLSCKCWDCRICSERLKRAAGLHFGGIFLRTKAQLYGGTVRGEAWQSFKRALRRAKASWVRVEPRYGRVNLIGTVPIGQVCYLSSEGAVQQIGVSLRAIHRPEDLRRYRPISSSQDWKQPPRDPPAWSRVGRMRTRDPDAVIACLAFHGLIGTARRDRESWYVSWLLPTEWNEQDARGLEAALMACPR